MTISTLYNIGDKLAIDGEERTIEGVHIFVSNNVQTERYYLGDRCWVTIQVKKDGAKR
jgi:hypothetical protein